MINFDENIVNARSATEVTDEQKKVLLVKPGLTDYASLIYINESEELAKYNDPQKGYIEDS